MSLVRWLDFPEIADERGMLVALEGGRNVPFEIKRVYYLYGLAPEARRGFHAHRTLQQVAICLSGRCRMLLDNGTERAEMLLDRPDRGLHIGPMIWREMYDFSEGCVLMVLASEHYDEGDYIRNYDEFLRGRST